MRVTVVHNTKAGCGFLSREELVGELVYAGHEVTEANDLDQDLGHGLQQRCDVVIAAGGDGTILSVAKRLQHGHVPLIVLPLGTANNFARTLGMTRDMPRLLKLMEHRKVRVIDLGMVTGTWGSDYFIESAGVGWFCDALIEAVDDHDKTPERAQQVLIDYLANYRPRSWSVQIDDQDASGNYVLIDVMNAGMMGPNLHLGPTANPCDGAFDVVLVTAHEQPALLDYLHDLRKDQRPPPPELQVRRARHVRFELGGRAMRVDGNLRPRVGALRSEFADVRVLPGAVRVWLPEEEPAVVQPPAASAA